MARTLVIGDLHEPASHPGYLDFCRWIRDQWRLDDVVLIGDVIDWHALSAFVKHPELPGPADEYELAKLCIARWHRAFPKARVCIGNHDARATRKANEAGLPSFFLKEYADLWATPGWDWRYSFEDEDVYYFHGKGFSGKYPARNAVEKLGMSCVLGHVHTAGGIQPFVNPKRRMWGMSTGCGIDRYAMQFAYSDDNPIKAILSCGVVIDGHPYYEMMPCGPGERFHRQRYKKEGGIKP